VTPIVDKEIFDQVQRVLSTSRYPNDAELLKSLRELCRVKGGLSYKTICKARNEGTAFDPAVYCRRFGSLLRTYELVGFKPCSTRVRSGVQSAQSARFRDAFMQDLVAKAPNHYSLKTMPGHFRHILEVDGHIQFSVRICPRVLEARSLIWRLNLVAHENPFPTLLVLLDRANRVPEKYFLLPEIKQSKTLHFNLTAEWISAGKSLPDLGHLYQSLMVLA